MDFYVAIQFAFGPKPSLASGPFRYDSLQMAMEVSASTRTDISDTVYISDSESLDAPLAILNGSAWTITEAGKLWEIEHKQEIELIKAKLKAEELTKQQNEEKKQEIVDVLRRLAKECPQAVYPFDEYANFIEYQLTLK